jgi:hypothetical protein
MEDHALRNTVSAAYNHALYLELRARMMQDWADNLERIKRGGRVCRFRRVLDRYAKSRPGDDCLRVYWLCPRDN